ncbi:MAG: Chromate resistance protein ChrB [Acidimicrobiales bacterium]
MYADDVGWVIVVVRVPSEPSRHRVAVWRELRRGGAIPLAAGAWALPDTPLTDETVDKVGDLIARAPEGEVLLLDARGRDGASESRLREQYTTAREAEWIELLSECAKFAAEVQREVAKQKFTLAELEEEEQSLNRLRRWHRELALRDAFGAPSAGDAAVALKESTERLEDYTEQVYRALGH